MNTYEKIKALRLAARMSQQELATRTGYGDRSSIAKIESGKVDLSESKILLFAKVFDVSPAYLMGLQEQSEDEVLKKAQHDEINEIFDRMPPELRTHALALLKGLVPPAQDQDDR